jgi:phage terminase large subunit
MSDVLVEYDEDLFLPVYRHLQNSDADINFLWGGRDSGKSQDTAQRKILKCLSATYFREILIKKTSNSIKDSQWQTIKDITEEWGISHLFTFTTHPLEITCINGNKFIARGCDDAGKLKSIRNPSGAWIEEGNQLTEEDWITILTTIRNDKVKIQIDVTFNPECEGKYEEFHLYKTYFKEYCEKGIYTFTGYSNMTMPDKTVTSLKYTSTHSTYHDNPNVPPERIAIHESLRHSNPYFYDVYTLGIWGKEPVGKNPFCHAYDPVKHESEKAIFNPVRRLIISIDFNVNPFAVIFKHIWRDQYGEHNHTFDEGTIENGSIPKMIDFIKTTRGGRYVRCLSSCILTGDLGGNRRDISQEDNASWFKQIMRGLGLSDSQLNISYNPFHKESNADVNEVLLHHPDYKINPKECPNLCWDMRSVQANRYGEIIKANRSDTSQRADHLDAERYAVHNFMKEWIETQQRNKRR